MRLQDKKFIEVAGCSVLAFRRMTLAANKAGLAFSAFGCAVKVAKEFAEIENVLSDCGGARAELEKKAKKLAKMTSLSYRDAMMQVISDYRREKFPKPANG